MALTSVPRFRIPHVFTTVGGSTFQFTSHVIDAVGERVAYIFRAPEAGQITKIGFRGGAHTTNGDADVRLETVDDTTGFPTGTLVAANANGTVTINASQTWWTATLTSGPTVARGDRLAVVIEVPSGSGLATNIAVLASGFFGQVNPYVAHHTTVWAKAATAPVFALEYSGGVYYPITGAYPYSAFTTVTFNSSTGAADERGNRITLPCTARAVGAYLNLDLDAVADLVLYDTDGSTALATVSLDPDIRATTSAGTWFLPFPSPVTLNANSTYRLALKPTSTTNIGLPELSASSSAIMTGAVSAGATVYLTTRVDAGAWSDTATSQAQIGLEFDQIDLGGGLAKLAGVGGGLVG